MKAIAAGYKIPAGPDDKGDINDDKGNPLMRAGTQKPEWKTSLRLPFLALVALTLFLSLAVHWK